MNSWAERREGDESGALSGNSARHSGCSPCHSHPCEHEVFILEGRGTLVERGRNVHFSKEDMIVIPLGEEHLVKNSSKEPLAFICLIPNPK